MGLNTLADGWSQFFHASGPVAPLAIFRIAFGALLVVNGIVMIRDLAFLYGPGGAVGAAHRDRGFRQLFSVFTVLPSTLPWIRACLAVHIVAASLLTVGLATRVSAVVVFVTLISLQSRNPLVTYGGDDVMRVMSFLLIFSPAGETWSADAWMAQGSWETIATSSVWCLRLMQLQVSMIYLKAFVAKLSGETWRNGRAVYLATEVTAFRRRGLPIWLRGPWSLKAAAWATLAIEGALGSLVWVPAWRAPIVGAGVALHLGLEWFLNVFLFGAVMIACLLLFPIS